MDAPQQPPDCKLDAIGAFHVAPCSATYNFKDHPQTPEQLREKSEALWQLLDDISTAFDMAKPKLEWFERYVWGKCEQRSQYFQSDGYKLYATDKTTMKCEICNDGPPEGPAIYRVNKPGDLPARWRCAKHLTPEQSANVDAQVRDIVETIEGKSPNNQAHPTAAGGTGGAQKGV